MRTSKLIGTLCVVFAAFLVSRSAGWQGSYLLPAAFMGFVGVLFLCRRPARRWRRPVYITSKLVP